MGKLDRVRNGRKEYERLLRKVEELEALAERTTTVITGTPRSGSGIPVDDSWAKLIDYKNKCLARMSAYLEDCENLEAEIESCIKKPHIRAALKARYVDCLKVSEVARLIGYEPRNTYLLLAKGRRIYEGVYENKKGA